MRGEGYDLIFLKQLHGINSVINEIISGKKKTIQWWDREMQINIQWQKSSVIKTYVNLIENKLEEASVIQGSWELLHVDSHCVGQRIQWFLNLFFPDLFYRI